MAANCTIDLELIAQRVLKLAEIATLEHLQGLLESQAEGLLAERSVSELPHSQADTLEGGAW